MSRRGIFFIALETVFAVWAVVAWLHTGDLAYAFAAVTALACVGLIAWREVRS